MYEPFMTSELAIAASAFGRALTRSYTGVSEEVGKFISKFRRSDNFMLVASMEAYTEGLKASFDEREKVMYQFLKQSGHTVTVCYRPTKEEPHEGV